MPNIINPQVPPGRQYPPDETDITSELEHFHEQARRAVLSELDRTDPTQARTVELPAMRAELDGSGNTTVGMTPGGIYFSKHAAREARRQARREAIAAQDKEAGYAYGLREWLAWNERNAARRGV